MLEPWAGRLGPVRLSLPHPPLLHPPHPPARASRSGIPHPRQSDQSFRTSEATSILARPPNWHPGLWTEAPGSLPGVARGWAQATCRINTNTHTDLIATITPPHFLLFLAPGSTSKASEGTEPLHGG